MTLAASIGGAALADDWPMANHDPRGSRNQDTETTITAANVGQLAPRWVLDTAGNVYATPLVVAGAVYVPDQGGKMWKVDATTGAVLWSTSISDYNGVPNTFSRTSPAYGDGMVFVADNSGAHLIAIDADSGTLRWITQLDNHIAALLTGNPVVVDNRIYMGVSSMEQTQAARPDYLCCTFRRSVVAVDVHSGQIVWKTYTMPENGGTPGGFSGGAVVSTPAVDVVRGLLFIGTDHQYTQPDSVVACLKAAPDDWSPTCYSAGRPVRLLLCSGFELGQAALDLLRRWGRYVADRLRPSTALLGTTAAEHRRNGGAALPAGRRHLQLGLRRRQSATLPDHGGRAAARRCRHRAEERHLLGIGR